MQTSVRWMVQGQRATVALVAAWRRASRVQIRPGRTLLGLVCPMGALRVRWIWPDLTGTGVLCCLVRSTTVLDGGDCSFPRGRSSVDLGSLSPHPRLADLVTSTLERRRWWLRNRVGAWWWAACLVVSRPFLVGLLATDCLGLWIGLQEKSLLIHPTPTRWRSGSHLSFLKGVVATLHPLSFLSGETLGPVGPGSSIDSLLEGVALYSSIRC